MGKEIKYNLSEKAVICGLSLLVGVLVSALALLFSAAFYLATDMNEMWISPLSAICAGMGSLVAGFLASRKIKVAGMIHGLICGGCLYLLVMFLSLFFSETGFSLISVLHGSIMLICGMIGGVLGVLSATNKKLI